MASVNKVIIVGNLGRDPETRAMPSGDLCCNIVVATTDKWTDKNSGEKKEQTEWHRVAFFGRLAEVADQYLRKGAQVYVEGSLRTRKYTDKDGVEKYATEIRGETMQMLGSRQGGQNGGEQYDQGADDAQDYQRTQTQGRGQTRAAPPSAAQQRPPQGRTQAAPQGRQGGQRPPNFADMDDDIPFAGTPKRAWAAI